MAKKVDKNSGLLYEVKRPAENKTYSIDFKNIIPSGQTISSVDSVVADYQSHHHVCDVYARPLFLFLFKPQRAMQPTIN